MPPVELEQGEPVARVVEEQGGEAPTGERDVLERVLALGDDLADPARIVEVDGDHPVEGRVAVRQDEQLAADRGDDLVVGVGGVEQGPDDGLVDAVREVGDVDPGLGIGAALDGQDQQRAVVRDLRVEQPLGLLGRREHDDVVGRLRPDPVIAQGEVPVRRVVRGVGRRFRVAAVEEAGVVVGPCGARELAPRKAIGQLFAGRGAADGPRAPVRPGVADRARDELAALAHLDRRQRRGAMRAQPVRVEEHGPLPVRCVGRPQHVLVLEAGVAQLEPAVPASPGRAGSREVPQRGQPLADLGPRREGAEDALGQPVLRLDPGPGRRRVAVLKGTVRVRDPRAVVVVDLVGRRGLRVGQPCHDRHRTGSGLGVAGVRR